MENSVAKASRNNDWAFNGKNYLLTVAIDKYQYATTLNKASEELQQVTITGDS